MKWTVRNGDHVRTGWLCDRDSRLARVTGTCRTKTGGAIYENR